MPARKHSKHSTGQQKVPRGPCWRIASILAVLRRHQSRSTDLAMSHNASVALSVATPKQCLDACVQSFWLTTMLGVHTLFRPLGLLARALVGGLPKPSGTFNRAERFVKLQYPLQSQGASPAAPISSRDLKSVRSLPTFTPPVSAQSI